MGIRSAFLIDLLKEDVYVEQRKGFEGPHHEDLVYRLNKAFMV